MFEDTNQNAPVENNAAETPTTTQESQSTIPTAPTEQVTQQQPEQQANQAPVPPATPVKPQEQPIKTTQEERMWAAIGYVAFLGVVTLAMKPNSVFCRKHASQGLVLFIAWFVGLILLALPSIISLIGLLLLLAITVLSIYGIVRSIQSYEMNIPGLSAIAGKVPVDAIIGGVTGKTVQPTPPTEQNAPPANPEDPNMQQPPQQ